MSKIIILLVFLIFSCSPQNRVLVNKTETISIYHKKHIVIFRFNKSVESIYWANLSKKNNVGIFIGGSQRDMIPATKYTFTFTHKQDTMRITTLPLLFGYNHFFDNMEFKKGNFEMKHNSDMERIVKNGKDLFINDKILLNTRVIYRPYGTYKGETKKLKDIEFEYYDVNNKDIILKKIEKNRD